MSGRELTEKGRAGECSVKVPRQTGRTKYEWDFMPCRRPAKFIADGREFCWQHRPSGAEEILKRREIKAPAKPKYLNSKQVGERYGHTESWARHCKELRLIARKVGKFLMWREDELEALETAQQSEDRKDIQAEKIQKIRDKFPFSLAEAEESLLSDADRNEPKTGSNNPSGIN